MSQNRVGPRNVEALRLQGDQALESHLEGDRPQEHRQPVGVPVQDLRSYCLEVGAFLSAAAISLRIESSLASV